MVAMENRKVAGDLVRRKSGISSCRKPVISVERRGFITDAGGLPMRFCPSAGPLFLATTAWLVACRTDTDQPRPLTTRDSSAIEAVRAAYVRAWLEDDTAAVLATLDSSAVLLPPGRLAVAGHDAIRAFWWPTDGSRTSITSFTWTVHELAGTPELAYIRGVSTVGWRYEKDTVRSEQSSRSVSLTILVPGADGQWRILRQMWGPPLR
jgi:ketosteroid isomerase-like protein